jgi:hypothetical protein
VTDTRAEDAISFIAEQIARLQSQIGDLKASANNIARAAGLAPPYPDSRGATPTLGEMAVAKIPSHGQFAHHTNLSDAVHAYFEWRGRALGAVSLDDLLTGLVIGGLSGLTRDEAGKTTLRDHLAVDPRFGRLRNGYYAPVGWIKKTP